MENGISYNTFITKWSINHHCWNVSTSPSDFWTYSLGVQPVAEYMPLSVRTMVPNNCCFYSTLYIYKYNLYYNTLHKHYCKSCRYTGNNSSVGTFKHAVRPSKVDIFKDAEGGHWDRVWSCNHGYRLHSFTSHLDDLTWQHHNKSWMHSSISCRHLIHCTTNIPSLWSVLIENIFNGQQI